MSPDAGGAALDYLYDRNPEPGVIIEIVPGVSWLTMPLPSSLNHINLWLLEDGDGVAIVDTGIFSQVTRDLWLRVFAGPLAGRRVTRLFVTHAHPDHIGLAGWLTEQLGTELWISKTEWHMGRRFSLDPGKILAESGLALFKRSGLGASAEALMQSRTLARVPSSPVPELYHRLEDGMTLHIGDRDWQVLIGRGHAPEHCCLWCPERDILIAGDQVLPKITPNVSLWPGRDDDNPLGNFLATVDKLELMLPDSVLVLPSHNLPFRRLYNRLQQLRDHHAARMEDVLGACDRPKTAAEMVPLLFQRKLDQRQMTFAMGEALAHLQYGATTDRLTRTERTDGAWLFHRI
jgi:glyoxylase-like metal-dependent hydrolase (beta-lactamase superfamily II)